MPMTEFFEPSDVARALGLSANRIRSLATEGVLRVAATTVRGSRLFRPEDVEALRQQRAKCEGKEA